MPERLAGRPRAGQIAANLVPSLPVRPDTAESYEGHVLATICVELLQPLSAMAPRWTDGGSTSVLGRVEVKLRHLESIEKKVGRDLGVQTTVAETRGLLAELKVTSRAPKREGTAPSAWFVVAVDDEEALVARQAFLSLAAALRQGAAGSAHKAGSTEYRFRDAPAVLAFWSMKVETCSPGITQRRVLRLARRSPRQAIEDSTR